MIKKIELNVSKLVFIDTFMNFNIMNILWLIKNQKMLKRKKKRERKK